MKTGKKQTGLVFLVLAALLTAFSRPADVQNDAVVNELLERAETEIENMKESAAMDLYSQVLEIDPEHTEALWNLSLLYSKEGHRLDDESVMRDLYGQAKTLAETCLDHHPDRAECHYVYAVAVGRISDISRPRERVRASKEIKRHIEKTLEIDPGHKGGWHLLGVWHSSVANISGSERFAAGLLYGGTPDASNSEAEGALRKAVELDPDNILFNLDLARHYVEVGRDEDAIGVLEGILQMEVKDKDDPANLERVASMLDDMD